MKKIFIRAFFLWALLALASLPAWAQRGGKAEPGRVEFKKGAFSATVSNTVRGDEQAEYVFSAGAGQKDRKSVV